MRSPGIAFVLLWSIAGATRPPVVAYWDLSEAISNGLSFDEQVTALAFQGLVNGKDDKHPRVFFNAGKLDFDWAEADPWWRKHLADEGRIQFRDLDPDLCALVEGADVSGRITGLVKFAHTGGIRGNGFFGDGYSMAIALTFASQFGWLPVTPQTFRKHACLQHVPVKVDLASFEQLKDRTTAWRFAIDTLLPNASKTVVFNLNHYRSGIRDIGGYFDAQRKATIASIDYGVQQGAFFMDLETQYGEGPLSADGDLMREIFSQLDPLFSVYGWSVEEFGFTNLTSHAGGTIMCSFASPNLSFWARLACDAAGRRKARRLPSSDRGLELNHSKYYLTFQTNEGDTPRIIDSNMGGSWPSSERGSLPIAWSVDPLLAESFPALFDHYAATAGPMDSFIAGVAGAGYVYLNQLSEEQLAAFATRTGRLLQEYGPNVVDTYGYASVDLMQAYTTYAAGNGSAPAAYVSQPNWDQQLLNPTHFDQNNLVTEDGTPIVVTSGDAKLFYWDHSLKNVLCPSCELANRIKKAASEQAPPYFILAYGGLHAFSGLFDDPRKEFFRLLHDTVARLGDDFEVIGAQELARLAREAAPKHVTTV